MLGLFFSVDNFFILTKNDQPLCDFSFNPLLRGWYYYNNAASHTAINQQLGQIAVDITSLI